MLRAPLATATAVLVAVAMAACGGSDNATENSGSSTTSSSTSSEPTLTTLETAAATTTEASTTTARTTPPALATTTTSTSTSTTTSTVPTTIPPVTDTAAPPGPQVGPCEDPNDDGSAGFDLINASFESADDGSFYAIGSYVGTLDRDVVVSFILGSFQYQIGIKQYGDGSPPEAFVFDFSSANNTYLAPPLVDAGGSVITVGAVVPAELVGDSGTAGAPVAFRATLTVDGADLDSCPTT